MPDRLNNFTDLLVPGRLIYSWRVGGNQLLLGWRDGRAKYFDWSRISGSGVSPREAVRAAKREAKRLRAEADAIERWARNAPNSTERQPHHYAEVDA